MPRTLLAAGLAAGLGLALPLAACDSAASEVTAVERVVSFGAGGGVDLTTGAVQVPGTYANSDLFATDNGDHLKLASGSDKPTTNGPVNWFMGAGGVHQTFASLADVPAAKPPDTMTQSLTKARAGNGFVVQTARGTYVRGWIREATATQVTLEFEPL